jgi:hypothetical protein
LKVEDAETLEGRRLGLKLRPMNTWWMKETLGISLSRRTRGCLRNSLVIQFAGHAAMEYREAMKAERRLPNAYTLLYPPTMQALLAILIGQCHGNDELSVPTSECHKA